MVCDFQSEGHCEIAREFIPVWFSMCGRMFWLFENLPECVTAINDTVMTGDVRRGIGGEKNDCAL
jgi:hypothetical protein